MFNLYAKQSIQQGNGQYTNLAHSSYQSNNGCSSSSRCVVQRSLALHYGVQPWVTSTSKIAIYGYMRRLKVGCVCVCGMVQWGMLVGWLSVCLSVVEVWNPVWVLQKVPLWVHVLLSTAAAVVGWCCDFVCFLWGCNTTRYALFWRIHPSRINNEIPHSHSHLHSNKWAEI